MAGQVALPTLLWCRCIRSLPLPMPFFDRVDQLLLCAKQEEQALYWPVSTQQHRPRYGWCNGTSGYVFLWTQLFKYTGQEKYPAIAEKCANHSYKNANSRNANLLLRHKWQCLCNAQYVQYNATKSWLAKADHLKK